MPYQINKQYNSLLPFVEQIHERFANEGDSIYKVRNEVKVFSQDGFDLNVKSYKIPNLFNRLAYRYLRKSKAKRAFEYASFLKEKGIETPAPIAWVEQHKAGVLRESYFISIQHKYDFTLREVLLDQTSDKENILKGFVDYTVNKLHKNGVFHLDYSPGNVLIRKENNDYSYSVIDLNRMKFIPIDTEKGIENLKQLHTTEENYRIIGKYFGELVGLDGTLCSDMLIDMDRKYQEFRSRRQRFKSLFRKKK